MPATTCAVFASVRLLLHISGGRPQFAGYSADASSPATSEDARTALLGGGGSKLEGAVGGTADAPAPAESDEVVPETPSPTRESSISPHASGDDGPGDALAVVSMSEVTAVKDGEGRVKHIEDGARTLPLCRATRVLREATGDVHGNSAPPKDALTSAFVAGLRAHGQVVPRGNAESATHDEGPSVGGKRLPELALEELEEDVVEYIDSCGAWLD